MRPRSVLAASLALSAASLAPALGHAQAAPASLTTEVRYQSYSFDEETSGGLETLGLTTLRFSGAVPLGQLFALGVAGAWGEGTMERTGSSELTMSGFTDTQLSLTYSPNAFLDLSAIALLSTGDATQTLDESRVAGALATDLLPFLISNWGNGGGLGINATVAYPVGSLGAGLSVGYVTGREFEPLDDDRFAYRPGDLLRIVAALDGTVGDAGKASLKLTWHRYGEDEVEGQNLFRSGNRFQALGSLAVPVGSSSSGLVYAGVTHREGGSLLDDLSLDLSLPSQDLILVGGGIRTSVGGVVIQPDAELRVLTRSDEVGQGFDVGVGARAEFDAGSVVLSPSAHLHFGELEVRADESGSLFGFDVGLAARFGGVR